jgi:glutamine synthetase
VGAGGELEFYLLDGSGRGVPAWRSDYHVSGAAAEVYPELGSRLRRAGVWVEGCKGEAGAGQHELNVRWRRGVAAADDLWVSKHTVAEWARARGLRAEMGALPCAGEAGSGLHVHVHLEEAGENIFAEGRAGARAALESFVAGVLLRLPEVWAMLLPREESYRRIDSKTWGPTEPTWAWDHRGAAVRVVGHGRARRVEVRVAGVDANPYLLLASIVHSGLDGIEKNLRPPLPLRGSGGEEDADDADTRERIQVEPFPLNLADAAKRMSSSTWLPQVLGEDVAKHYAHFYTLEAEEIAARKIEQETHKTVGI